MDSQREDGMLTVEQVADKLGLTRDQVYRRIVNNQITAVRVRDGKTRYLVHPDAVGAYIDAGGTAGINTAPMIGVPDVAAMTGFTVETVRRLCEEGKLPHVRGAGKHGHFRIPRSAVLDYLRSNGIDNN